MGASWLHTSFYLSNTASVFMVLRLTAKLAAKANTLRGSSRALV